MRFCAAGSLARPSRLQTNRRCRLPLEIKESLMRGWVEFEGRGAKIPFPLFPRLGKLIGSGLGGKTFGFNPAFAVDKRPPIGQGICCSGWGRRKLGFLAEGWLWVSVPSWFASFRDAPKQPHFSLFRPATHINTGAREIGAGNQTRTGVTTLEEWGPTTERYPRQKDRRDITAYFPRVKFSSQFLDPPFPPP